MAEGTVDELPVTLEALAFAPGRPLGAGLRAAREHAGMTIDDISLLTRVRPAYIEALEDWDMARLPSRPFTIGYVRAYARALGLDEDTARSAVRLTFDESLTPSDVPVVVGAVRDAVRAVRALA